MHREMEVVSAERLRISMRVFGCMLCIGEKGEELDLPESHSFRDLNLPNRQYEYVHLSPIDQPRGRQDSWRMSARKTIVELGNQVRRRRNTETNETYHTQQTRTCMPNFEILIFKYSTSVYRE
jgi:hypothetical protein